MIELVRALAAFVTPPAPEHERLAGLVGWDAPPSPAAHTETFLLQLYPYASVYLGGEGQLGGEARDRVAGFIRALGGTPPPEPDHLRVLLELYATLAERHGEADPGITRNRLAHARRTLLWEHLLSWTGIYLPRVAALAPDPYPAWARLLTEVLQTEADALGLPLGQAPAHLRDAPAMVDPRIEGADAFVRALLAPVRSGMVVTRSDLAELGRELGLGVRIGERAFVLRALVSQDAAATLRGLAAHALAAAPTVADDAITAFWRDRAAGTAALLGDLADAAQEALATASSAPGTSPGRQKSSISTA